MKNENETVTNVSVLMTHLLTTQGKTFIDGELIKLVSVVATDEMCLETIKSFKSISLLVTAV